MADCTLQISSLLVEEFGLTEVSLRSDLMELVKVKFVVGVMVVVVRAVRLFRVFSHNLVSFVE